MDNNILKLSDLLINYSTHLKLGENLLIEYEGECCLPLVKQLIRDTYVLSLEVVTIIFRSIIYKQYLSKPSKNKVFFFYLGLANIFILCYTQWR